MKLVDLPVDRPVATVMLLVSVMVLGLAAAWSMPLGFIPKVAKPEVEVSVPFPGSHPTETLREVVEPIEEEIAAIPDVQSIRSTARSAGTTTTVEFAWSVDIALKRLEVREAVERASARLPPGIGRIQVKGLALDGPAGGAILQGRISAERDLAEAWDLLEHRLKRPLERIPGVAYVSLYGVEAQRVRIDLDMAAVIGHGLDAGEILRGLDRANLDLDLGAVRGDVVRYDVRFLGRFQRLGQIRSLPLAPGIKLGDVAEVTLGAPPLRYGRHLDRRYAIGIDVFKEPAANAVETTDRLLERIREVEQDPQLEGIRLLVWSNAGDEIRTSLGDVRNAGMWGGLLAVLVLFGFLRRTSTTLIVAVAIPFSLLATCGAMFLLGSQFDVLTLMGLMLGVGMLVDNAVVVIENIHRLQSDGLDPAGAAKAGARGVFLAVVASTATTVIVWSWLVVTDKTPLTIYLGQVAMTICLAVVCSLLVSVTFIPLAAARFVPGGSVSSGPVMRRVVPAYRGLLGWTLRHRLVTLVSLLVLAGSAALPILSIEKTGEPRLRERAVRISYTIHGPADKDRLEGYVDEVEAWLEGRREELGYETVYSWYSEREDTMTMVYLPRDQATARNLGRLRSGLREGLPRIPGVTLEVGERMWWRRGSQGRRMVALALHGEDPDFLRDLAKSVEEYTRLVPGTIDVQGPGVRGRREVVVAVDAERAHTHGTSPEEVALAVAFIFRGRILRRFQGPDGELDLVCGLPETARTGLDRLRSLPLPTAGGVTIPLSSVADVRLARTQGSIRRIDREITTWVNLEFDPGTNTEDARERVASRMLHFPMPEGYTWSFGKWGKDRDQALGTMAKGVGLSMLVVVLLLVALFESFTQPLAIVVTLPLAFFGAFWLLWLGGYNLDAVAFIGLIILIGIVVNNGIVMVDHVNALRRGGHERVEALLEGCGNRLRPVLMTAITTLVGLIPLALSSSTVAGAYIDALAVAVIGGLATSTLFTLVALPVWYTAVEDAGAFLARLVPRRLGGGLRFPQHGVMAGISGRLPTSV